MTTIEWVQALTSVEPGSEEERALEAAETGLRSLITERAEESA